MAELAGAAVRGSRSAGHGVIQRLILLDRVHQVAAGLDEEASSGPETGAPFGAVQDRPQCGQQRLRVAGRNRESGLAVLHNMWEISDPGRDDGDGARHSLEDCERQSLAERGKDE